MTAVHPRQVVWLICLLSAFVQPRSCPAAQQGAEYGLLFEITAGRSHRPSYLFGTIHSEDPRVTSLPAPVQAAFADASAFALEVVPDSPAIIKAMMIMTYTDGRQLKDVLPPKLYRDVCGALGEMGMSEEAFKDYKPWAIMNQLSAPRARTGDFLDIRLYRSALRARKRVTGLETMGEQLAIFDDLSESDQIALLAETLAARSILPRMLEQLIDAYLERDLAQLQALSDAYLEESDPRLAALFRSAVINVRNRRMADRMAPLLDEGGWFIAIGALHLPGETGVVRLLRAKGYRVRPIY